MKYGEVGIAPGGAAHVTGRRVLRHCSLEDTNRKMGTFALGTFAGWSLVVLVARLVRGTFFAVFAAVIFGVHALSSVGLAAPGGALFPVFVALQVATLIHFLVLSRPRMRGRLYRAFVSWPASWFVAACFLGIPWSVAHALGLHPPLDFLPFALATVGFSQSMFAREEDVHVRLDDPSVATETPVRAPLARQADGTSRPLRIVQLTDTHLGPFMSVDALAAIAERAVARDPDLILLTGDYMTMESQQTPEHLVRALAPLAKARGRVFACHGNHDHEAPDIVAEAMRANGITLLLDDEAVVETAAGPVQIIGAEFTRGDRAGHLSRLAHAFPRREGHLRLWLLHHPGAFADIPEGEADLVLSGHTHGGQLGLVSLGLPFTAVSAMSDIPDHGLWARGRDRLYVHRGTCHYGFPLRLGVPSERSMLHVTMPADGRAGQGAAA